MNGTLKKFSAQKIAVFENTAYKLELIEIYSNKIWEELNKLNKENSKVLKLKIKGSITMLGNI